jgi:hypothetical protein
MSQPNAILYKSKTWLVMQCLKDFGDLHRDELTAQGSDEKAAASIRTLMRTGYVKVLDNGLLHLTLAGLRKLREVTEAANPPAAVASKRTISNGTTTEPYLGENMGRTCLRPGAYDAFEKPSLMMGQRVYRKEIKA